MKKTLEPAKWATACNADALSPASRARPYFLHSILGLAPQALCSRPLRGLARIFLHSILGLEPASRALFN